MISCDKLIGLSESAAISLCKDVGVDFSVVYTKDKKTVGNDKIVVASRESNQHITLIVGYFMLGIKEDL